MRFMPGSKHYLCVHCRGKYMLWMGVLSFQGEQAGNRKNTLLMEGETR
jgi:hypothetical protein